MELKKYYHRAITIFTIPSVIPKSFTKERMGLWWFMYYLMTGCKWLWFEKNGWHPTLWSGHLFATTKALGGPAEHFLEHVTALRQCYEVPAAHAVSFQFWLRLCKGCTRACAAFADTTIIIIIISIISISSISSISIISISISKSLLGHLHNILIFLVNIDFMVIKTTFWLFEAPYLFPQEMAATCTALRTIFWHSTSLYHDIIIWRIKPLIFWTNLVPTRRSQSPAKSHKPARLDNVGPQKLGCIVHSMCGYKLYCITNMYFYVFFWQYSSICIASCCLQPSGQPVIFERSRNIDQPCDVRVAMRALRPVVWWTLAFGQVKDSLRFIKPKVHIEAIGKKNAYTEL